MARWKPKANKNQDFVSDAMNLLEEEISEGVFFIKQEDGRIKGITSEGELTEIIGIMEYGKFLLLEDDKNGE